MENTKQQLEEVIKKEKLESELAIFWDKIASYLPKSIERSALGDDKIFTAFKQAYIEFRPLIADEVLKVIIRKIEEIETFEPEDDFVDGGDMEYRRLAVDNSRRLGEIKIKTDILQLLSNLSINKENKNNDSR